MTHQNENVVIQVGFDGKVYIGRPPSKDEIHKQGKNMKKWTKEEMFEILSMQQDDKMTIKAIAEKIGKSVPRVNQLLARARDIKNKYNPNKEQNEAIEVKSLEKFGGA